MNSPQISNQPFFFNAALQRMKALQKIKNNLMLTLANYIENTTSKQDTLASLSDIQKSTCPVLNTNVNGQIIPGVTISNNECNC